MMNDEEKENLKRYFEEKRKNELIVVEKTFMKSSNNSSVWKNVFVQINDDSFDVTAYGKTKTFPVSYKNGLKNSIRDMIGFVWDSYVSTNPSGYKASDDWCLWANVVGELLF